MPDKKTRKSRSAPSLDPAPKPVSDDDFATAVEAAAAEIRIASNDDTWGLDLDDELREMVRLEIELEAVRKPARREPAAVIFEAAQAYRKQEAKVQEMTQRRLAWHKKNMLEEKK